MSRIDEIKYRNLNWDQIDFTIQSNIDRIFSDQQYLLSRLQIAEEALQKVYERDGYMFVHEALQQIRSE